MKKFIIANALLIATFIGCIIAIGLSVPSVHYHWTEYADCQETLNFYQNPSSATTLYDYANICYTNALRLTFSLIFCSLGAIASATVFILINPQIFRKGRVSEVKAKLAARQEQAQAEKARVKEERKAAKIAKLEQELETLKKEDE